MKRENQIISQLESLCNQYKSELTFLQNRNMTSFDVTLLPPIMQKMIQLAIAKTPSFSNISALAVANFVLGHLFGQLRPRINDPMYSDDEIGINTYSIVLARSGGGKDSTYQALTKSTQLAADFIIEQTALEAQELARTKYIKDMKKGNPEFDESKVQLADYEDYIKSPEIPITSLGSTRGGLTTSLNRMARSSYGTKSLYASELGLAIQSNSGIVDVLELFSILYDMGQSVAPEFKTEEAKEESVNGMFPNLLGISSPAPFYTEGNVRKLLIPMLLTSLARRITVVFSNAKEEFENEYIPSTPAEKRMFEAKQRQVVDEYTRELNEHFLTCVKLIDQNRTIMFTDEAGQIYDDYKSYTQITSKALLLRNGDSVEGIEMSGRAFKLGRIAAIWAMASGETRITKDIMIAAIYFADYTAQHLLRFADTLNMKDYELFIADWQQGFFDNVLPIDQAITKGYINVKSLNSQSINNFLKPVNSRLEGVATVSYSDKSNCFIFVPVVKSTESTYTYRACGGHTSDRPINNIATNKPIDMLGELLKCNCSFNPFGGNEATFVTITVTDSFLSMQQISKYLSNIKHFIATTSDPNNHHAFVLNLPISSAIKPSEYKYVTMSIANQLMLRIAPEHCEYENNHHGYANSTLLTNTEPATVFDISAILGNLASQSPIPLLATKPDIKPTKPQIDKYLQSEILDNQAIIVDMLNVSKTPLLLAASIVYDMAVHGVDSARIAETIDSINASLEVSFGESVKQEYLIEPFNNL